MVPAPRQEPDGATADALRALRDQYQSLPPPFVRWQTQPGRAFLDQLFAATDQFDVKTIAPALGITPAAVYYMLERTRSSHPRRWPSPEDLRELSAAWRVVRGALTAGRSVRRTSPEYVPVHAALNELLDQQFQIRDIALAMSVLSRQLNRFLQPPLESPEAVARVIDELLPQQGAERLLADNPPWRE